MMDEDMKGKEQNIEDIQEKEQNINESLYKEYLQIKSLRTIAKNHDMKVKEVKQAIIDYCNDNNIKIPNGIEIKGAPEPANVLPKRDGTGPEKVITELSAEVVANNIYGIHQILAMMVRPEFAITKDEAKIMGDAIYNVIKDYNLEFLGKYSKYIDLAFAVAVVEVPCFIRVSTAIKQSKKVNKKEGEIIGDSKKVIEISKELGIAKGEPLK